MATLHREYTSFNADIKLTSARKDSLTKSRNSIKDKIKKFFQEEKPDELQPSFIAQGSIEMNTTVNPIPEYDEDDNKLLKYDLDLGVYFVENEGEDNKKNIVTWHNWVFNAVDDHTNSPTKDKATCVRVYFKDGHHIDLPIYYDKDDIKQLAHKSKGWIDSNPPEFTEWFNNKAKNNQQLRRIVRYLKAWKNYKEFNNSNLKFPSGFALTILAVNHFKEDDSDDIAFRNTIESIKNELVGSFTCIRPTTPEGEDLFEDYSETRKNDFLNSLKSLLDDCKKADNESNFKKASEYLHKHLGERFPMGEDKDDDAKSKALASSLGSTIVKPKPYANNWN